MLYPSINELLKKVDSRYTLVMMVSKRARQLVDGDKPLVDEEFNKTVTTAINEVAEDKIEYIKPEVKGLK
ncbi:DNA-directed RNA polymerase subunit omega [Caldisalinibacter kiritimatiensis]|uniref:DNA-directed RNA polymerase subunit omega n=1 Tax=Caldisalinibacter kiritimatiensis TaxID=1304284 RepID=R1CG66_9FIRM|nr:DNA-directed RNA polymerase subunit omega [Caldisalinibacter kiritimatiensis]EOD01310.1 DNA-directed RNA polymerase omega subunit [Caldisalinibacter kiritimatiensis]